jgi:hypothetical protein
MPAYPVVDSSMLREAAKQVRQIEPEIRKRLIAGLKADLKPTGDAIAKAVPTLGRPGSMRGFGHSGRTAWGQVKASVHVTPGGGRGSLARFDIFSSPNKAAFKIADLAGTRGKYGNGQLSKGSPGYLINGQGQDMVSRLTDFGRLSAGGKGGRFVWANFLKKRPDLIRRVEAKLDIYCREIEGKIGGSGL